MSDVRPELPYIGAVAVAYVGYIRANKTMPPNSQARFIALIAVILFVSSLADTKLAPLANAFGLLTLLTVIIAVNTPKTGGKKKL